jgi:uncharacterized integral membrane protein (TIGR02327 family)
MGHLSQTAGKSGEAAFALLIAIAFVGGWMVTWWSLSALKWEEFVQNPRTPQVTMLRLLLAIVGGLLVASVAGLYVLILWVIQS